MYVHQSRSIRGWWSSISYHQTGHIPLILRFPTPPLPASLPEPAKLCALTHQPRAWRIIRVLALAGNGISLSRVAH